MDASEKGKAQEDEGLLSEKDLDRSYGSTRSSNEDASGHLQASKAVTPLPSGQLLVVFIMRLAEPIAYTQIFPVSHLAWSPKI